MTESTPWYGSAAAMERARRACVGIFRRWAARVENAAPGELRLVLQLALAQAWPCPDSFAPAMSRGITERLESFGRLAGRTVERRDAMERSRPHLAAIFRHAADRLEAAPPPEVRDLLPEAERCAALWMLIEKFERLAALGRASRRPKA